MDPVFSLKFDPFPEKNEQMADKTGGQARHTADNSLPISIVDKI